MRWSETCFGQIEVQTVCPWTRLRCRFLLARRRCQFRAAKDRCRMHLRSVHSWRLSRKVSTHKPRDPLKRRRIPARPRRKRRRTFRPLSLCGNGSCKPNLHRPFPRDFFPFSKDSPATRRTALAPNLLHRPFRSLRTPCQATAQILLCHSKRQRPQQRIKKLSRAIDTRERPKGPVFRSQIMIDRNLIPLSQARL